VQAQDLETLVEVELAEVRLSVEFPWFEVGEGVELEIAVALGLLFEV